MKRTVNTIKHDIPDNWAKAINFIPKDGELIMYDGILNENKEYIIEPKFKIGDGTTKLNNLQFIQFGSHREAEFDNGILKI